MLGFLEPVDRRMGDFVFKNRSGFVGNIAARLNIFLCKVSSDIEEEVEIGETGFEELNVEIDHELVNQLSESFDKIVEEGDVSKSTSDDQTVIMNYGSMSDRFDRQKVEHIQEVVNTVKPEVESLWFAFQTGVY